jgi:hypothetical protein
VANEEKKAEQKNRENIRELQVTVENEKNIR